MYEDSFNEIWFSVLDYYVSVLHQKRVNIKYSIYYLSNSLWSIRYTINSFYFLFFTFFITSISDSLTNVCGHVLVLVVRPLDFGYLAVKAGIH